MPMLAVPAVTDSIVERPSAITWMIHAFAFAMHFMQRCFSYLAQNASHHNPMRERGRSRDFLAHASGYE
jgi:hypothetical protein